VLLLRVIRVGARADLPESHHAIPRSQRLSASGPRRIRGPLRPSQRRARNRTFPWPIRSPRCSLQGMSWGQRQRPVFSAGVLLILVLTLVGHVCVLPLHGHGESPAHDADTSHHGPNDSVHASSCEAVRSAAPTAPCAVVISTSLVAPSALTIRDEVPPLSLPQPTSSPPLFLLHAALLI
jgi:hypothetical protein